ncbi:MAG: hypothetical protein ACQEP9_05185 [Bacillota bacterium]
MDRKKSGYALIVVLWSIMILTIIFVNLIDETQLNNLLVRNNLNSKELQQAAVTGVLRGVSSLKSDKTTADTIEDDWFQPTTFEVDDTLSVQVEIVDIGSKLNINYLSQSSLQAIQEEFEWEKEDWDKLEDKLLGESDLSSEEQKNKLGLIPRLEIIKSEFATKEDYQQFENLVTTYGKFDVNLYGQASFSKLLYFLKAKLNLEQLNQNIIETALEQLPDKREQDSQTEVKKFTSVEDFLRQAFPTQATLREKIAPYLTVRSRININFVSQEVLQVLLKESDLAGNHKEVAEKIATYCDQNKVEKLSELDAIGVGIISNELKRYFTTSSTYLLIKARASNTTSDQEQMIKAVVHKIQTDKQKFKFQIINWRED